MSKYKYALLNIGIWEDTPTDLTITGDTLGGNSSHICVKIKKDNEPVKCAICGRLM